MFGFPKCKVKMIEIDDEERQFKKTLEMQGL